MRGAVTEQTITYTSNSNRLNQLNGVAYNYDAAGNTTTDGPGNRTFTYDDTGRLTEARVAGVLKGTYLHNAEGQRVRKIEATGAQRTFYFHYGLNGELLAETLYTSSNQKLAEREYVWVDALPVAFAERTFDPVTGTVLASQLAYLHADHLGTPRIATDAAQRVVWRWSSDAFGIGAAESDPDGDTIDTLVGIRLPGQYFDGETGLHYNYFRDYDPAVGRYVQSDPIGLLGGMNTYAYVLGNPLSYADPAGMAVGDLPPTPPGYNSQTWERGVWDSGRPWVRDPANGRVYTAHPEDVSHWRHWDIDDGDGDGRGGRWPPNSKKPWPNQKRGLKKDQCDKDPSGDAPPWEPPADLNVPWLSPEYWPGGRAPSYHSPARFRFQPRIPVWMP